MVKNLPANVGDARDLGLTPGSGRSPGEEKWQPTPVFLPGKFQGQRSLVGYSPRNWKESDTTDCAHTHTLTTYHVQSIHYWSFFADSELFFKVSLYYQKSKK